MKKLWILMVAGLLITASSVAEASEVVLPSLGGQWYLVTEQITGYSIDMVDGRVIVRSQTGSMPSGAAVPMAIRLATVAQRGHVVLDQGRDFRYPTTPEFLLDLIADPGLLHHEVPPATQMTARMDRQPFLTNGPDLPGDLYTHPRVNLANQLERLGYSLNEYQRRIIREWSSGTSVGVPGSLYITVFLVPAEAGKWKVQRWVYTFDPDWAELVPPPREPDTPPSGEDLSTIRIGSGRAMIVPADCEPDPLSARPCKNYPELKAWWYCELFPQDQYCKGGS